MESKKQVELVADIHHEAHDECFIARSVTTEIRCETIARP